MEQHLLEKEVQKILIEDLEKRKTPDGTAIRAYKYGHDGFMPVSDKKRFDVLIFHNRQPIPSPIALELKPNLAGFGEITKALHDQIPDKYMGKEFLCRKEKWIGVPPLFAFTTKHAVFEGCIYKNNFMGAANFFVNRFAWRFNVGVLYKINNIYHLSYQNRLTSMETSEVLFPEKTQDGIGRVF